MILFQCHGLGMNVDRFCSEVTCERREAIAGSQHRALLGVVRRIRASLALEEIFQTTAAEVSQLLQVDRVGIYRFLPEEQGRLGEFVAEVVREPYDSLLGWQVKDRYFAERYLSRYRSGRVFVLNDLAEADLQDCHREMLSELGLKASVVVSLLAGDYLWGLLTLHQCDRPRVWQSAEVEFVEEIALHLGIAIQQSEFLNQYKQQAQTLAQTLERNRVTENLVDKIRRSLDLNTIFTTATQEVRKVLEADWAAIFQLGRDRHLEQGRFLAANLPSRGRNISLAQVDWRDWPLNPSQVGDYLAIENVAIADLSEATRNGLLRFQTQSLLYIPIFKEETCWGLFCLHYFKQRVWTEYEIVFAQKIGLHLGIALQQTNLLMQARNQAESLNAVLAQAQRQKLEHKTVAQQEKALSEVIDKIRRTLDLTTIFQTTVTEVRQLLQGDRSAIFQFCPPEQSQTGIFVSEDRVEPFVSLLNLPPLTLQFWDYVNAQYFSEGRILAIDDTREEGIPPDVFALTQEFEVRANLVVPLFKGKNLWGLLCIHQCRSARVWHSSEIEFVLKVALNLGIALQQAGLLA
ncbi:MAG: GAF domain-containing protein, partial [Microcystaceae cyanobacterium]